MGDRIIECADGVKIIVPEKSSDLIKGLGRKLADSGIKNFTIESKDDVIKIDTVSWQAIGAQMLNQTNNTTTKHTTIKTPAINAMMSDMPEVKSVEIAKALNAKGIVVKAGEQRGTNFYNSSADQKPGFERK